MGKHKDNHRSNDIETGSGGIQVQEPLYPNMIESPQLRWGFIRKVYFIVTIQILITIGAVAVVYFVDPIRDFFLVRTPTSLGVMILIIVLPILVMLPMFYFRNKHPLNMILLVLFTICISMSIGLACISKHGKVVLETAGLTAVVVISLTLYTFWAAKRGYDFNFLGPFLMVAVLVLMIYGILQIFIPFGTVARTIIGCFAVLIFAAFIIYDTDNLIKRHNYDEYICASINLYLDIINLFLQLLALFSDD